MLWNQLDLPSVEQGRILIKTLLQGLNYLAGMALLNTDNEIAALATLQQLVVHILEGYYSPSLENLLLDMKASQPRCPAACLPARIC